jgi:hypothetical protein
MPTNNPIVWKLIVGTGAIAVMCALDPEAAVTALVQTVPNLAAPATALGFMLITAANQDRR